MEAINILLKEIEREFSGLSSHEAEIMLGLLLVPEIIVV
jgi:hypothetical protein